ncbi:beta-D-galactosidase [Capsaspora owczarzaki ATCC 30864]|uniref:Beta-galactosidase n=1 Tax=Capsaspora owczarzaki (strain ATCC 30864) TaxID=595528 RepID=A0A0D2VUA6_CAPO3|nr:beta-D-galactosidase [Capsaspora owczarzaki ATCC 30864]KJE94952.1 beta-D-galactosidase [Capsaspora owczarzaki ATCC 30864]|eukprot:XP_004346164.1 beta-D-galactosidase [Capsaspora owczarzaki ATCC 30864]
MRSAANVPLLLLLLAAVMATSAYAMNVTYDSRALLIDGRRRLLVSGSIHYPRSTPDMWPELFARAKANGIDVIQTYLFWNTNVPTPGEFVMSDRFDYVRFVQLAQEAGLYVNFRIGPFVCAEWTYGGLPAWLRQIPDIMFRDYDQPWLQVAGEYITKTVQILKDNRLLAGQGGPIILLQIENEYGGTESRYAGGPQYVEWCGQLAANLTDAAQWIMCSQPDAPANIIATCNAFYCDDFVPHPGQPSMWTENWPGWFQKWGDPTPHRPAQDVAYAVTRYYIKGGSYMNYYMYHGGTNFERTAGGPFITTNYDYDASLDEYGMPNEPKYSHLGSMHAVLHDNEAIMMAVPAPKPISLGTNLEAHIYNSSVGCVAFLSNNNNKTDVEVQFNGRTYELPAWSVSVLHGCVTAIYNTAVCRAHQRAPHDAACCARESRRVCDRLPPLRPKARAPCQSGRIRHLCLVVLTSIGPQAPATKYWNKTPLEQIDQTLDHTDYLWYSTSYVSSSATYAQLSLPQITDVAYVYVNGKFVTVSWSGNVSATVSLVAGPNTIDILSLTMGLDNGGDILSEYNCGLLGGVYLGSVNLTENGWWHQTGVVGERNAIFLPENLKKVAWTTPAVLNTGLTWYKSSFDVPRDSQAPLALDLTGMGKGYVWVNGHNLGRYWPTILATNWPCDVCDYRGTYDAPHCKQGCNMPSQTHYHVPREWLQAENNVLVLLEEMGGNPSKIALVEREEYVSCGVVGEDYPADDLAVVLGCGTHQTIAGVDFASYGTPMGSCRSYQQGSCHASNSTEIVLSLCHGKQACSIPVSAAMFGNPCPDVTNKRLAVQVACA